MINTHVDDLVDCPHLWIELDYPPFGQKGDLYRVDPGL